MNKKNIILITLFALIFGINNVSAMTLKPSSPSSISRGEEITIYITLDKRTDEKSVSAVEGTFVYDSNIFTFVSSSNLMENWFVLSEIDNNKIFSYANLEFNNLINNNSQDIVKVVLKTNDNAKYGSTVLEVKNTFATDDKGNSILIEGGTHNVEVKSNINKLSDIKVSNGNINFNEDILNYNLTVENDVTSIKVDAILKDNRASYLDSYGPRTVNLSVGKNLIQIKVKAENEETKTYTLNVTRKQKKVNIDSKKSSNNYLSYLKIKESNIAFNKELLEYQVSVPYDTAKINVEYKTEHSKSKTNISGNRDLKVGKNIVIITVTAEDGSTREYKILVTKKEEEQTLSSNSRLKNLSIKNHSIVFNGEKYVYNIKIENEKSLDIIYTKDDPKSNVTITGNENLKDGSVVIITVLAEDGSSTVYKVNIEKKNNINIILLVSISMLFIISLILIICIKIKRKKDNINYL